MFQKGDKIVHPMHGAGIVEGIVERKMLHSAKQILISELVLSQDSSYEDIEARINHSLIQS